MYLWTLAAKWVKYNICYLFWKWHWHQYISLPKSITCVLTSSKFQLILPNFVSKKNSIVKDNNYFCVLSSKFVRGLKWKIIPFCNVFKPQGTTFMESLKIQFLFLQNKFCNKCSFMWKSSSETIPFILIPMYTCHNITTWYCTKGDNAKSIEWKK